MATARIPDLSADKITSDTFATARIPSLPASRITAGTFDDARIPNLSGAKITSGTVDEARIDSAIARDTEVNTKFDTFGVYGISYNSNVRNANTSKTSYIKRRAPTTGQVGDIWLDT